MDYTLDEPPAAYDPPTSGAERLDWLRLIRSRRVGPATFHRLIADHGTAAAALEALPGIAAVAGVQGYASCPVEVARAEVAQARVTGARLLCRGEADYPAALAMIADAPPVLWVIGDAALLNRPTVALVGARNASSLGLRMARRLAGALAEAGFVVASGLARGIDACVDKPLRQASIHHALATALGITQARTLGHTAAHGARRRFNGRVLVAEDNAVNQRLTAAQLARFGVHADIVANGVEALTAIAQLPYDLVLMDCQMPEMDGYQATREIRHRETMTNRRRLPVIAMTANAMAGDRDLCLAAGMDDYIAKPVRIEALAEALARFLPEVTDGVPLITGPASTTIADDPDMLIDPRVLARLRDELGDESIFVEMVTIFVREAPDHVGALERAMKNGDTETVRRAAHKLKGSCQIMGASRLAAFCRRVEEHARSSRSSHADDANLQRLLDETLASIPLSH